MKTNALLGLSALLILGASTLNAVITSFDFQGQAGFGLLPGNETGLISGTPGTGGEVGAGIFFDDTTNQLTINLAWGSSNGFTDLTGDATMGHIHGPVTSAAPAAFTQNASPLIDLHPLGGWSNGASNGGFTGVVNIAPGNVTDLFDGKLYINIHTPTNAGGEIRGNLIPVPEPATYAGMAGLACLLLVYIRRRQ